MDMPTDLATWKYDTVVAIVKQHEHEPGYFDYKAVLHATDKEYRDKLNDSIRRTACSMANADGGFILFGIKDRSSRPIKSDPLQRIVGIPVADEHLKQFQDKVKPIQPEISFTMTPRIIRLPHDESRGIFVVHIPRSPRRPHMDESVGVFYRRGPGGAAEAMRFYEVREQMIYGEERMRKITLLSLQLQEFRKLTAMFLSLGDQLQSASVQYDTSGFRELLVDVADMIPTEGNLLEQLRLIPTYMQLLNADLQQPGRVYLHTFKTGGAATRATPVWNIYHELKEFDEHCAICASSMEKVFGAIGGRKSS